MNCYLEMQGKEVLVIAESTHGLREGDTVRLSVTKPEKKTTPDRVKAMYEVITTGAGKAITGGSHPSARGKVASVTGPMTFTVAGSDTLSAADFETADADPCDTTVDPIYYLTCCVMGLGCDA